MCPVMEIIIMRPVNTSRYKTQFSTVECHIFQNLSKMKFFLLLFISCALADAISMNRYLNNRHVTTARKTNKQNQPDFFIQTLMKLQQAGKSRFIENYMNSFPLKKISRSQNYRLNRFTAQNRRY